RHASKLHSSSSVYPYCYCCAAVVVLTHHRQTVDLVIDLASFV
ncbi:unnamed protein product, partial [Brassica oleracea]